jgi:hypothetical protein
MLKVMKRCGTRKHGGALSATSTKRATKALLARLLDKPALLFEKSLIKNIFLVFN